MSSILEKINEKTTEILNDRKELESISKEILNKEFFLFIKEMKDYEKLDGFFSILFELYKNGDEIPLLEYVKKSKNFFFKTSFQVTNNF